MVAEEGNESLSHDHQKPPTIPLLHHPATAPRTGPAGVATLLCQLAQGSINSITEASCVP